METLTILIYLEKKTLFLFRFNKMNEAMKSKLFVTFIQIQNHF